MTRLAIARTVIAIETAAGPEPAGEGWEDLAPSTMQARRTAGRPSRRNRGALAMALEGEAEAAEAEVASKSHLE